MFHWTRLLWLNEFTDRELIVAHCSRSARGRVRFITTASQPPMSITHIRPVPSDGATVTGEGAPDSRVADRAGRLAVTSADFVAYGRREERAGKAPALVALAQELEGR